jgi:hypothetical protein
MVWNPCSRGFRTPFAGPNVRSWHLADFQTLRHEVRFRPEADMPICMECPLMTHNEH